MYSVFCGRSCIYGADARVVVCVYVPGYAGGERSGIEGWGKVFGHEKYQG
jgi:hypothetical protein